MRGGTSPGPFNFARVHTLLAALLAALPAAMICAGFVAVCSRLVVSMVFEEGVSVKVTYSCDVMPCAPLVIKKHPTAQASLGANAGSLRRAS